MIPNPHAENVGDALTAHRVDIEHAMARYLAGFRDTEASTEDKYAARLLLEALIASFSPANAPSAAHKLPPIARNYYSRFGDGLAPILKDVFGSDAPASLLSRAVDGYWSMVQARRG